MNGGDTDVGSEVRRKQGRPPVEDPKTELIRVRVTPEEKRVLVAAAAAAGLTLSGYLLGDKLGQIMIDGFDR